MRKINTFLAYLAIFLTKRVPMLKNKFHTLCQNFTTNNKQVEALWSEISISYSNKGRYYHSLAHLRNIYNELKPFKLTPAVEFSIFYHDIVYNTKERDNEEKSAILAINQLHKLSIPNYLSDDIYQLIIETKKHQTNSSENALFLDADISILGTTQKNYIKYIQNIRKEYAIYSDEKYNKGRKSILKRFLEKDKIYISNYFYNLYEKKARNNIRYELELLQ